MKKISFKKNIVNTVAGMGVLMLTACNGIFDGIYDEPEEKIIPAKGQLVIDATSWADWYYVDLDQLHQLTVDGDEAALLKAQTEFQAYPIPMEATGGKDETEAGHQVATAAQKPGQYMYWFDALGEGLQNNAFRHFVPTESQPEPETWSFAVHRDNVRTNGAAVLETTYTSMDEMPETSESFHDMQFTEDEWSETDVWDSQEQMLLCLVPSQGIKINKLLSSWLSIISMPPPTYGHNNHVFVLRLKNGKYAALQLANYLSPKGTKCYLTINYKYPY